MAEVVRLADRRRPRSTGGEDAMDILFAGIVACDQPVEAALRLIAGFSGFLATHHNVPIDTIVRRIERCVADMIADGE